MAITLERADGFEHGVFSTYTVDAFGSSPTAVTTGQRSGLRACQINPAATTEFVSWNSAGTVVTLAFFIKFTTLPTVTGAVIARIRNTNGNLILDWNNTTSQLRVKAGTGTAASGGPTITTGTWYRVVMEYDTSTGTFNGRCTIDATTEFSSTVAATTLAMTDVSIGATSSSTYDAVYDDLIVSITDGDYEQILTWTDWEILSAIPTSDGTHEATVASGDFDGFTTPTYTQTSTNVNANVGHRPLQAANTANNVVRMSAQSATKYMEVLFENPSNTHPNVAGVQTHAGHVMSSATGTPDAEMRLLLSDNTEVLTKGSISMINSTEDPGTTVTGRKRATIAPAGGWDETKVDGLKVRLGFQNAVTADVNFIDCMIQVAYFATAGAAATSLPLRSATTMRQLIRR